MRQLYDLAGAEADRRFSPYCWRARMALAHKELEVETIAWRYADKPVIARTGEGKVPVLVDGERWVHDSWAIANYLEDAYPERPSLFGGPVGRALSRFYANWADTVLNPGIFPMLALDIWKHCAPQDQAYFRRSREERLGRTLEAAAAERETRLPAFRASLTPLRLTVTAQPFLGGTAPLYADYAVFGAFQWARVISEFVLLAEDDPIRGWRDRMMGLYSGLASRAKAYPV